MIVCLCEGRRRKVKVQWKNLQSKHNQQYPRVILGNFFISFIGALIGQKLTIYRLFKDQIDSYGVDPSGPLPDEDGESNGIIVAEPLCPLSAEGLSAFTEEMAGVAGTDVGDISPYLRSLDIFHSLKQQYRSSSNTDIIGTLGS